MKKYSMELILFILVVVNIPLHNDYDYPISSSPTEHYAPPTSSASLIFNLQDLKNQCNQKKISLKFPFLSIKND